MDQHTGSGRKPKDEKGPERVSLRLTDEEREIVGRLSVVKTFYGNIRLSASETIRGLIKKAGQR